MPRGFREPLYYQPICTFVDLVNKFKFIPIRRARYQQGSEDFNGFSHGIIFARGRKMFKSVISLMFWEGTNAKNISFTFTHRGEKKSSLKLKTDLHR